MPCFRPLPGIFVFNVYTTACEWARGRTVSVPFRGFLFLTTAISVHLPYRQGSFRPLPGIFVFNLMFWEVMPMTAKEFPSPSGDFCF